MELVTEQQWFGYAKRLEKETYKAHGKTLTARSIAKRVSSFIADVPENRHINTGMVVKSGWRKAMREIADGAVQIMNQRQATHQEPIDDLIAWSSPR